MSDAPAPIGYYHEPGLPDTVRCDRVDSVKSISLRVCTQYCGHEHIYNYCCETLCEFDSDTNTHTLWTPKLPQMCQMWIGVAFNSGSYDM